MLRVLLIDDQKEFRNHLRQVLERAGTEFTVVGEAASGLEGLELAAHVAPDVAFVDVQMPGINGFITTRRLVERLPGLRVLVTSMFKEKEYSRLALESGAVAFLHKRELTLPGIRSALDRSRQAV